MARRGDSFSSANYVPEFADIIHVDWAPAVGHEMVGPHYGLVLSDTTFNTATGMVVVAPITSKTGKLGNMELAIDAKNVRGTVLLASLATFDYRTRNMQFEVKAAEHFAFRVNTRIALFLRTS